MHDENVMCGIRFEPA